MDGIYTTLVTIFLSANVLLGQNKAPEMTKDFKQKYGQTILENTQRTLMRSNDTTYADFWNLALSQCLLTDDKDKVETLLLRSKASNAIKFGSLIEDSSNYYGGIENTPFHQMLGNRFAEIAERIETENAEQLTLNTDYNNKKLNIGLIESLKKLYNNDQKYRQSGHFNHDTSLQKKQKILDDSTGIALRKIFRKHGYPGNSLVGRPYSSYAAIMLAHTNDLELFKELFPFVVQAYRHTDLDENIFLLLVDKLHWRMDGKQIFGTQAGIPFYNDKEISKYKRKYLREQPD